MIGPPDEVRERPPGKVWVYNHGPCRVEVYLYPSVDVASMAVLGSALAPDSLADDVRDRCRRILARRTAKAPCASPNERKHTHPGCRRRPDQIERESSRERVVQNGMH